MAQLRATGPYIWVTWLPRLLSGGAPVSGHRGSRPSTKAGAGAACPPLSTKPTGS